jgi:hypothetical protein
MAREKSRDSNSDSSHPVKREQRQVRADAELVKELQEYAYTKRKALNEIYDESLKEFHEERKRDVSQSPDGKVSRTFYLAPFDKDARKPFNVALPPDELETVSEVADTDGVSTSRVLYNAVAKYLMRRKVIR